MVGHPRFASMFSSNWGQRNGKYLSGIKYKGGTGSKAWIAPHSKIATDTNRLKIFNSYILCRFPSCIPLYCSKSKTVHICAGSLYYSGTLSATTDKYQLSVFSLDYDSSIFQLSKILKKKQHKTEKRKKMNKKTKKKLFLRNFRYKFFEKLLEEKWQNGSDKCQKKKLQSCSSRISSPFSPQFAFGVKCRSMLDYLVDMGQFPKKLQKIQLVAFFEKSSKIEIYFLWFVPHFWLSVISGLGSDFLCSAYSIDISHHLIVGEIELTRVFAEPN